MVLLVADHFTNNKAHAKFRDANDVACYVSAFAPLNVPYNILLVKLSAKITIQKIQNEIATSET